MFSTNVARLNQCASEKLVLFKPVKVHKTQCQIHPLRANCKVIKQYDEQTNSWITTHLTLLDIFYLNYDLKPYYTCLINKANDNEKRGVYANGKEMYAYVQLDQIDKEEKFYTTDEAGEYSIVCLKTILKTLLDCLASCRNQFILMIDELQIDLVYSVYRTIVLPQRMWFIWQTEKVPITNDVEIFSVPLTDDAKESQIIYRSFLVYNTILTMMLKQRNPFNETRKNISITLRNLGKCPNNKERVKCCDLNFGGSAPGHIMCPPREMIKKIFHYAKWARTPNNYRRYFELITTSPVPQRMYRANASTSADTTRMLIVLDWYNFIDDFRAYFGIVSS
ncbi:VP1054 [Chrysodeixis includens nucleopolyhedrovirus]|uniref:VP1054 n=1 Tax=Chrysodeixis includens nucleopolyhedrovirus TaxID=1207438 RepID=A0A5B8YR84_9ABAC|nr:VP1054 [Chrysodeixis includens nucleopolyhedrovirus]QED40569.1 VP1054 [Chrysodeixis includens nucleopolyhedrovirus]